MKLKRTLIAASLAAAVATTVGIAQAQMSDGVVKIGVLNDGSSLYADLTGQGSVVAARLAIEDFGAAKFGPHRQGLFAEHRPLDL